MDRTRLRHNFLRSRSVEDRQTYNQLRNYCVAPIRKIKKDSYNNVDYKKIIDNKTFGNMLNHCLRKKPEV